MGQYGRPPLATAGPLVQDGSRRHIGCLKFLIFIGIAYVDQIVELHNYAKFSQNRSHDV